MRGRQIWPSDNGRECREGLKVDGLNHIPGSAVLEAEAEAEAAREGVMCDVRPCEV